MSQTGFKHHLKSVNPKAGLDGFLLRFRLNSDRATKWLHEKVDTNTFLNGLEDLGSVNLELLYRLSKATFSLEPFGFLIVLAQFKLIEQGQEGSSRFTQLCTSFPEFAIPRQHRMTGNSIGNWIYEQFIAPQSPYELNLASPAVKQLKADYESPFTVYTAGSFDVARQEAISLLQTGRRDWKPDGAKITV